MKVLTRGAGRLTRYRTSLKRDREREKGRLLVRSVVESRSWSGAGSLKRCVILAPVQLYNNLTSAQLSLFILQPLSAATSFHISEREVR